MRTKVISGCLFLMSIAVFPQTGGGEFKFQSSDCLSDIQRVAVKQLIKKNQDSLTKIGKLQPNKSLAAPPFIWPVKKSSTAPFNEVWSISNYVDHNANYPNQLLDYDCGNRTYDTNYGYNHAGIDIFTWPFGWYQMDNDWGEIVAAAPGIIIAKSDGNYDRNCQLNSLQWNAVYVQHDDGSVAWYGHMKKNSLTTKSIGETVAAGEYLGIVGSSGSSTGPHLHFEVYNNENVLVDPYEGTCNTWTSSVGSLWATQKPYRDPKINGLATHSSPVVLNNGCGVQETVNFKNDFLLGEIVYPFMYLADILPGSLVTAKLIRPDNSVRYTYNFTMDTYYPASYYYYEFPPYSFDVYGEWKFSVTVSDKSLTHNFTYANDLAVSDAEMKQVIQLQNPVKNNQLELIFNGSALSEKFELMLYSAEGRLIKRINQNLQKGKNVIPINVPKGNYILKAENEGYEKTFKVSVLN